MLAEHVDAPRGWTAETVGAPGFWTVSLPEALVEALAAPCEGDEGLLAGPADLPEPWLADVRGELDAGRGFVVLAGISMDRYSMSDVRRIYWRTGACLGTPVAQNVEGDMLYDVKDFGKDIRQGARFSVTNAESTFHTDAAFADVPPEYIGLLCLNTAKSGGESQLVSAWSLHNALLEGDGDQLRSLYDSFPFDRRGQFRPGEPEIKNAPVFRYDGDDLDTRYLRFYIDEGDRSAGAILTDRQRAALDAVDSLLGDPGMRVTFALQPGQMLFTNNHWILHNRTAFQDHPDPERRRHYLRLWLMRRGA